MDNNNRDNSFELYSRRQSTRDVSASNDTNNTSHSMDRRSFDEYNPTSISTISGNRSTDTRTSSVKIKPNRKRSTTGSDVTDRSDASNKTTRLKGRNALTSSFLRRKRVEYAGMRHFYV